MVTRGLPRRFGGFRWTSLTAFVLLLTACSDSSDDEAWPDDDDSSDGWADEAEPMAQPQASDDELPPALGTAIVSDAASVHNVTITSCSAVSLPGREAAGVMVDLRGRSTGPEPHYRMSFQIQVTPELSRAVLLGFADETSTITYTGRMMVPESSPYTLLVNGAAFDVTTGNNGALEPAGSGYAPPVSVALEVTTQLPAQYLADNETRLAEALLDLELAAQCALSWRFNPGEDPSRS